MRLGVDLGGTKIEIAALAGDGRERLRRRIATPDGYEAIVAAVARLVNEAEGELGTTCQVGIGTPGTWSRVDGRFRNSNTVCLNGKPLRDDLQRALGREVRLANDANCFALSEAHDGAAAGADVVFGVILGTGVGGGLVVHGRVLDGPNGIAGEWGHNPLPVADEPAPPACYCGRRGCVESFLSGPGLLADHRRHGGVETTVADVVTAAANGEADCRATLERYCERLARGLATVINIVDPDLIVLGGGVSNIDLLYAEVPRRWMRHVFSDRVDTRLVRHRHGDSSGVRGAALLWPEGW
ncbi:MAG TPA: ROK family protein [Burkholderiaceae bacterium]|nr:ROK family protein [Burkholderiaceae bacterium]